MMRGPRAEGCRLRPSARGGWAVVWGYSALAGALVLTAAPPAEDALEEHADEPGAGAPGVVEPALPEWAPADAGVLRPEGIWLGYDLLPSEPEAPEDGLRRPSGPRAEVREEDGAVFLEISAEQAALYAGPAWRGGVLDPRALLPEPVRHDLLGWLEARNGEGLCQLGVAILGPREILPGSTEWVERWAPAFGDRPAVAVIYALESPALSRLLLLNAGRPGPAAVEVLGFRQAALEAAQQGPEGGSGSAALGRFLRRVDQQVRDWEIAKGARIPAGTGRAASKGWLGLWADWLVLAAAALAGLGLATAAILRSRRRRQVGPGPVRWPAVQPLPPRFGGVHCGGGGGVLAFRAAGGAPGARGSTPWADREETQPPAPPQREESPAAA